MTSKLKSYSTTPGSNNAAVPDGFPEGMAVSGFNNSAREMMARLREWYQEAEWIDLGHTIASSTGSTIVLSGDQTAYYTEGRPIRVNQSGSQVGYISSSSYAAPNTTVNVSGFTVSSPTQVEVGIVGGASFKELVEGNAASAADIQAGTNTDKPITPATLRNSDMVPKSVARITSAGAVAFERGATHTVSLSGGNVFTVDLDYTAGATGQIVPQVTVINTMGTTPVMTNVEVTDTNTVKVEFVTAAGSNVARTFSLCIWANE